MTNDSKHPNTAATSMADLMLNYSSHPVQFNCGDQVTGKVIYVTESEVIVELGAKSEGVLPSKELVNVAKAGDSIEAFVVVPENESGQVVLSAYKQMAPGKNTDTTKKWQKMYQVMQQKTKLLGNVLETNKGGLVVEISSLRGFLPSSQISISFLMTAGQYLGVGSLVGQKIPVRVLEIDPESNRLILSTREEPSEATKEKLGQINQGEKVTGKIAAITSVGLVIDINGLEGVVHPQEIAWERVEDLNKDFEQGQQIEAIVVEKEASTGIVYLSLRQLEEDPFKKIAEKYQTDDVKKGQVVAITTSGVIVKLEDGIEGFIPSQKVDADAAYSVGQSVNVVVDSVDHQRRKIQLSPFITSTVGLIYK